MLLGAVSAGVQSGVGMIADSKVVQSFKADFIENMRIQDQNLHLVHLTPKWVNIKRNLET
jgi:hypothetical protein